MAHHRLRRAGGGRSSRPAGRLCGCVNRHCALAQEWIDDLGRIALSHRLIEPVGLRRLAVRHVQAAEQGIQERQLAGEIPVAGLAVVAVMPVMEFRRRQQETQRPEADAGVGVNENRLPIIKCGIDGDGRLGKPERKHRDEGDALGDNLVEGMNARRRQPVELFDAVMDGVEAPQPRHRVEHAVGKVEAEIGQQDHQGNLDRQRPGGDGLPQRRRHDKGRGREHSDRHAEEAELDDDAVEQQEKHIVRPGAAQDLLLAMQRQEPLQGHEDQARDQNQLQTERVHEKYLATREFKAMPRA